MKKIHRQLGEFQQSARERGSHQGSDDGGRVKAFIACTRRSRGVEATTMSRATGVIIGPADPLQDAARPPIPPRSWKSPQHNDPTTYP